MTLRDRRSVLGNIGPLPDGTIGAADRSTVLFGYYHVADPPPLAPIFRTHIVGSRTVHTVAQRPTKIVPSRTTHTVGV